MLAQSESLSQVAESPISTGVKNGDSETAFSYLGTTTESPSLLGRNDNDSDIVIKRVLDRYYLQSVARDLLPSHRIKICHRFVSFKKDHIKIVYRKERKTAAFQNLAHCDALWVCAVCASTITEHRRGELKTGLEHWKGKVLLVTFTMRHKKGDTLKGTLSRLLKAYERFLSGSYGQDIRANYGIVGLIKALEVTWGENGWHPHLHVLIFCEFDNYSLERVRNLEKEFKRRWIGLVKKVGGSANMDNGLTIKDSEHFVREYVTKYGHEPTRELWTLESEVSKANVKKGRGDHYTPFQLLELFGDGWEEAGERFKEFAETFAGKKQLIWSRGLKKLLGVDEVSDKEILDAEDQNPYEVLTTLNLYEWRRVRERNLQGSLIIVASHGDVGKLEQFLIEQKIRE